MTALIQWSPKWGTLFDMLMLISDKDKTTFSHLTYSISLVYQVWNL